MTGNEPIAHFEYPYSGEFGDENKGKNLGLTIREYFAAKAMQGMCANPSIWKEYNIKDTVAHSIELADALIKELNKPNGNE